MNLYSKSLEAQPCRQVRRSFPGAAIRRSAIVLLAGLSSLAGIGVCTAFGQDNPRVPVAEVALTLGPGKSLQQFISGGQPQRLEIRLKAGQYVRLDVDQSGTGLFVEIAKPSGGRYVSRACRLAGIRSFSIVAGETGLYKVVLRLEAEGMRELYQLSLTDLRRSGPKDSRRVRAEQIVAEADLLRAEWKSDTIRKAIQNYTRALIMFEDIGDVVTAARLNNLIGEAYQSVSDQQRAFSSFRESLKISRQNEFARESADALNAIGYLHYVLGENQQALDASQEAHKISVSVGYRRGEAVALTNIGDTYYGFGELSKAVEPLSRANELLDSLGDKKEQVRVLVSLGYAFLQLGETTKALSSYEQAVTLSQIARDRRLEAISLRALGNLKTLTGDRQEALTILTSSLNAIEDIYDLPTKADVFGGLGYLYDGLGEKNLALDYYERARAIFASMNHRWGVAEVGMVIGGIHYAAGDYKKALTFYHESLSLFRVLVMPRYEAWMLRDIGLIHDAFGEKDKALDYFRQALSVAKSGQDQRYTAQTLNCIGRTYASLRDWKTASSYYEQALQLNRIASDSAGEAITLYNMAQLEAARDDLDAALSHAEAALRISESLRTKVSSRDLRATYFGAIHQQFTLYIDILMRLHKKRPESGFDIMAFEANERGRARSMLEALAESRAGIRQGVDQRLLQRASDLQRQLNAVEERRIQVASSKATAVEMAEIERELNELTTAYQQVEGEIRTSSPRYAALVQPVPLTLKKIQQQVLDTDTALLVYALGEEQSFVWVVTANSMKSFELAARAKIEEAARRVYTLLTARNRQEKGETALQRRARIERDEARFFEASHELSAMLMQPFVAELKQKRLAIVADGALQYVPFAALSVPGVDAGLKPLITKYEIVSLPSVSVLALLREELQSRPRAPKSVAVLADPVFDIDDERLASVKISGRRKSDLAQLRQNEFTAPDATRRALRDFVDLADGGGIARLPFSGREAAAIIALVPAGDGMLASGFRANRAAAVSPDLSQYRYVHFATHGLLNSKHPELSGVFFSRFDESGRSQNGFLQLHDVYNLKLSAELVVLSACQTALGKDIRGEGLVGLTRGFMYAGAPRVVASLWQVDDAATAELMRQFYTAMLSEGKTPANALRAAQLRMWEEKNWASPYYWAAFTLQGEWR